MKKRSSSVGASRQQTLPFSDVGSLLSPRQQFIVDQYDRGVSRKEIADKLKISVNTIKMHVRIILLRTGARTCKEAAWKLREAKAV